MMKIVQMAGLGWMFNREMMIFVLDKFEDDLFEDGDEEGEDGEPLDVRVY